VFVANKSILTVADLRPDTGSSNFIYVLDDFVGGSTVSGVLAPLFVPKLTSASPNKLSEGINTDFVLKGSNIYPCGLNVAIYKGGAGNQIVV
jgi:hypothetical protein